MNDKQKTKAQLINELKKTRLQIDKLKSQVADKKSGTKTRSKKLIPRAPRVKLKADVELVSDFEIVQGKGINISEGGICIEIKHDLPFEIHFVQKGEMQFHRAHLIWVNHLPNGGYQFGLKFVSPKPYPRF